MILGLIGMCVLAIVFGHLARAQIRRTGEQGQGMANIGLIFGYIGAALLLMVIIWTWVGVAVFKGHWLRPRPKFHSALLRVPGLCTCTPDTSSLWTVPVHMSHLSRAGSR
ncbi:DUF4190 domain-containing protein (plasmid) [Pseudarthrobacter sp. P1]|uniref:DUF4190 domain-containing protein n=1 Tax=Pseudarthrobacter sp. P1 TaxID=3418418 RepID=UPI003CF1B347